MKEFDLKLGHKFFRITEKDRVYRNSVDVFSVPTQKYIQHQTIGYYRTSPNIAKAKAKKWIKEGILEEVRTTRDFVIYKFVKNSNEKR